MALPLVLGGVAAATALATLIESLMKKKGETGFFSGNAGGQISTLTPEQQKSQAAILQGLPQLLQQLQGPVQPSPGFENIANREMAKFQTQTIPSLAERFTAMGSPLSSGGYREALRRGAVDLHTNLAALGYQAGANERGQNLDLFRTLLSGGMSPSTAYMARQPGFTEEATKALLGAGGAYLGAGGSLGSLFGSAAKPNTSYNLLAQNLMSQQPNYLESLGALRGTNPRDFFANSGIMRG